MHIWVNIAFHKPSADYMDLLLSFCATIFDPRIELFESETRKTVDKAQLTEECQCVPEGQLLAKCRDPRGR